MTTKTKTYTARAIKGLGGAAAVWLGINAVGDALGVACAAYEVWTLSKLPTASALGTYDEIPDPSGIATITGLARLPLILVMIVTSFIVLKWVYRANRNAHAFGRGLQSDPPWAVGWFFVPVAWLWKPFEGMSETWRVSHGPVGWKRTDEPRLLRVWWGFWLTGNIVGTLSTRLSFSAQDSSMLLWATVAEALSAMLMIGAGLSLMRIVKQVTARQTALIATPPLVSDEVVSGDAVETPPVDPSKPWGPVWGKIRFRLRR